MPRLKEAKIPDSRLSAVSQMERFIAKYSLNWTGLSLIFGIKLTTISQWRSGRTYPSETVVNFLGVLEGSHEARELAGVYRWKIKRKRVNKPKVATSPEVPKRHEPLAEAPKPKSEAARSERQLALFDIEKFLEGPMNMWEKESPPQL